MYPIKIYLAGPEVFFDDCIDILESKKQLCKNYDFIGLSPLDGGSSLASAREIKYSNIGLIKQCDVIIANLNSFLGFLPDDGTAYEVGYAEALGKVVYGYVDHSHLSLAQRHKLYTDKGFTSHTEGVTVEDFNLPVNLMLSVNNTVKESFEDCLKDLYQWTVIYEDKGFPK